jgi:hypothetical protein
MRINDRLKNIIFKKLYNDLSHVEIIPYEGDIWFIDRNIKYWYLELKNNGKLWWRSNFFDRFFQAFSLERIDYESLIAEWVEEVLNNKVNTTQGFPFRIDDVVEEVLNNKVNTTIPLPNPPTNRVEEVLNRKVLTTPESCIHGYELVEEVLNRKVLTTHFEQLVSQYEVEEVLNSK